MADSASRPLRVFLCHSSGDKPTVRELYRRLIAEGWVDPWLDEEKLYPGQDWNFEIELAVEAADVIIVFLTKNSVPKEGYIQRELRIVLDQADYKPEGTLFIIPVRLEECEPPRRLRRWQYADYFPQTDWDRAYGRLLVSLRNRAKSLGILADKAEAKSTPVQSSAKKPKKQPILETPITEPKRETPAPAIEKPIPSAQTTTGGHLIFTFGTIEFIKVPAGKFLMGSKDNEYPTSVEEKPKHLVDIPYDYYMGRFPVTNEQYLAYLITKGRKSPVISQQNLTHPVVNVSWKDAQAYVKWLNDTKGKSLPEGTIFRLPTEAEWEKAARGTDGRIYPWGNRFDKNKCNSEESGKGGTTPVGLYSPDGDSPYGCADMAGNVWEFTQSLHWPYPYDVKSGCENLSAPGYRAMRGGSFFAPKRYNRCAVRGGDSTDHRTIRNGFRVAVSRNIS